MKTDAGRVFHTLDALRGIAAAGVVTFHMSRIFAPVSASGGYLAVDLFFMMSGVVISHAYETRFRAGMSTVDFMRARLIRLYPLYLLGTLLGIAVTAMSFFGRNIQGWDRSSLLQAALLALLLVPNLEARPVNELFPLNIPCWSLFFEIFVNVLFVVAWPRLTSRRLVGMCMLTGFALSLSILNKGSLDQGSAASDFWVGMARTLFGFSLGVLIARHAPSDTRRESNLGVVAVVAVFGVAIFAAPIGVWRTAWDLSCVLVIFPLVVYFGTIIDPTRWLQPAGTFLGVTSYALYVLHSPVSSVLNSVTRHIAGSERPILGAPLLGVAVLVLLLSACWLIDRGFDLPIRRFLNRAVPRTRAASA